MMYAVFDDAAVGIHGDNGGVGDDQEAMLV